MELAVISPVAVCTVYHRLVAADVNDGSEKWYGILLYERYSFSQRLHAVSMLRYEKNLGGLG